MVSADNRRSMITLTTRQRRVRVLRSTAEGGRRMNYSAIEPVNSSWSIALSRQTYNNLSDSISAINSAGPLSRNSVFTIEFIDWRSFEILVSQKIHC